jgi:hypothetical protein
VGAWLGSAGLVPGPGARLSRCLGTGAKGQGGLRCALPTSYWLLHCLVWDFWA